MTPGCIAALSYGVLTILGGIIGYLKSRSQNLLDLWQFVGGLGHLGSLGNLAGSALGSHTVSSGDSPFGGCIQPAVVEDPQDYASRVDGCFRRDRPDHNARIG